jgi:hypothetical protein
MFAAIAIWDDAAARFDHAAGGSALLAGASDPRQSA